MLQVPLRNRVGEVVEYALIDDSDAHVLNFRWYLRKYEMKTTTLKYSLSCIEGKQISMHAFLLGKPDKGYVIDHINNNGLDNRRQNIRVVTRSINSQNKKKIITDKTTSRYKGVSQQNGKWLATYATTKIGLFDNEIDAAKAYDEYVLLTTQGQAICNGLVSYDDIKNKNSTDILQKDKTDKELPKGIYKNAHYAKLNRNKIYYASLSYRKKKYTSNYCATIEEASQKLRQLEEIVNDVKEKERVEHENKQIQINEDGFAYFTLKNGMQCIVDNDKWKELSLYRLHYDGRYVSLDVNGKRVRLHRYLTSATDAHIVDHINHNRLDNRLKNLRLTSATNNSHNRAIKGQYVGIRKIKQFWVSCISKDGIKYNLGCYDNPVKAAIAYNIKALELYKEYANLNEIDEDVYNLHIEEVKQKMSKKPTSIHKGVCLDKRTNKWVAKINKNKVNYHIGTFDTEEQAFQAYNSKREELYKKD
jgi:hypothetical protein